MDEFVYMGEVQLKEHARKIERVNQRAWMIPEPDPEMPGRWRFRRVRDA